MFSILIVVITIPPIDTVGCWGGISTISCGSDKK